MRGDLERRLISDPSLLAQNAIYATLDALRTAIRVDLCAYLQSGPDQGPQLYLGVPTLADIAPTEAFNLFNALRDALREDHDAGESIELAGYHATLVTTTGERSRGLHIVGRREDLLNEQDRMIVVRLAQAFAAVAHQIEALSAMHAAPPPASDPSALRVSVDVIDDGARAEVGVAHGADFRTGTAHASTAPRAVALATIDAVDASLKLVEATDGEISGSRAVLVLIADGYGRLALGSALADSTTDPLRATATAALEASVKLARED